MTKGAFYHLPAIELSRPCLAGGLVGTGVDACADTRMLSPPGGCLQELAVHDQRMYARMHTAFAWQPVVPYWVLVPCTTETGYVKPRRTHVRVLLLLCHACSL